MSQIKLKHSGGNGVIIAAPSSNPAAARTLLLPGDGDSTIDTLGRTGNILQVKQTVKKDVFSESVGTGTESSLVTGLTVSITPSSSSNKILLFYQIVANRQVTYFVLDKDGSVFTDAIGDADGSKGRVTAAAIYQSNSRFCSTLPIMFMDSPADTSSHTYGLRLRHTSVSTQTLILNQSDDSTNNSTNSSMISSVTAMEVSA